MKLSIVALFFFPVALAMNSKNSKKGNLRNNYRNNYFTFETVGTGEQEVPVVETDTTSILKLSVDAGFTAMQFNLEVYNGIEIDRAHLHCGAAGENGQLLVEFYNNPKGTNVDGHLAFGYIVSEDLPENTADNDCGVNNIASLFAAMKAGKVYLNLHSLPVPSGINRGQIMLFPDN